MAQLHFWGVRGSIPTILDTHTKYGANTPCLSLEFDDTHIILDAGTGLYKCGNYLLNHPKKIIFLMSHYHWDHIQGLPYFYPLYRYNFNISICSAHLHNISSILDDLFDGVKFPMSFNQLSSPPKLLSESEFTGFLQDYNCNSLENHHPGTSFSYSFRVGDKKVVYCSDHELRPFSDNDNVKHVNFCKDSDVLVLDAHFNTKDHPERRGWGHSFLEDALELAHRANVKQLYLFHHDPRKSDFILDRNIKKATDWIKKHNASFVVHNATEGQRLSL
ncbi:hypothetical protein DID80_02255 [Candidatus Marinamargulisbacteria bacterium SCGC AAA071-K20]|nr:hypothetical protein DID80_02255 [Candidatus Marinamargulisbacteria bacterium SCGC AAA071-K20]